MEYIGHSMNKWHSSSILLRAQSIYFLFSLGVFVFVFVFCMEYRPASISGLCALFLSLLIFFFQSALWVHSMWGSILNDFLANIWFVYEGARVALTGYPGNSIPMPESVKPLEKPLYLTIKFLQGPTFSTHLNQKYLRLVSPTNKFESNADNRSAVIFALPSNDLLQPSCATTNKDGPEFVQMWDFQCNIYADIGTPELARESELYWVFFCDYNFDAYFASVIVRYAKSCYVGPLCNGIRLHMHCHKHICVVASNVHSTC